MASQLAPDALTEHGVRELWSMASSEDALVASGSLQIVGLFRYARPPHSSSAAAALLSPERARELGDELAEGFPPRALDDVYDVVISDGSDTIKCVLTQELNPLVSRGALRQGSVVRGEFGKVWLTEPPNVDDGQTDDEPTFVLYIHSLEILSGADYATACFKRRRQTRRPPRHPRQSAPNSQPEFLVDYATHEGSKNGPCLAPQQEYLSLFGDEPVIAADVIGRLDDSAPRRGHAAEGWRAATTLRLREGQSRLLERAHHTIQDALDELKKDAETSTTRNKSGLSDKPLVGRIVRKSCLQFFGKARGGGDTSADDEGVGAGDGAGAGDDDGAHAKKKACAMPFRFTFEIVDGDLNLLRVIAWNSLCRDFHAALVLGDIVVLQNYKWKKKLNDSTDWCWDQEEEIHLNSRGPEATIHTISEDQLQFFGGEVPEADYVFDDFMTTHKIEHHSPTLVYSADAVTTVASSSAHSDGRHVESELAKTELLDGLNNIVGIVSVVGPVACEVMDGTQRLLRFRWLRVRDDTSAREFVLKLHSRACAEPGVFDSITPNQALVVTHLQLFAVGSGAARVSAAGSSSAHAAESNNICVSLLKTTEWSQVILVADWNLRPQRDRSSEIPRPPITGEGARLLQETLERDSQVKAVLRWWNVEQRQAQSNGVRLIGVAAKSFRKHKAKRRGSQYTPLWSGVPQGLPRACFQRIYAAPNPSDAFGGTAFSAWCDGGKGRGSGGLYWMLPEKAKWDAFCAQLRLHQSMVILMKAQIVGIGLDSQHRKKRKTSNATRTQRTQRTQQVRNEPDSMPDRCEISFTLRSWKWKHPVKCRATRNLNALYRDGVLTARQVGALGTIDGVRVTASDRVLVMHQTNSAHNGIYTVHEVGSDRTKWVLARSTDANRATGASGVEWSIVYVQRGNSTRGAHGTRCFRTRSVTALGSSNIEYETLTEDQDKSRMLFEFTAGIAVDDELGDNERNNEPASVRNRLLAILPETLQLPQHNPQRRVRSRAQSDSPEFAHLAEALKGQLVTFGVHVQRCAAPLESSSSSGVRKTLLRVWLDE